MRKLSVGLSRIEQNASPGKIQILSRLKIFQKQVFCKGILKSTTITKNDTNSSSRKKEIGAAEVTGWTGFSDITD